MKDNLKTLPYVGLLLILVAGISAAGQTPLPQHPGGPPQSNSGDPIRQLNLTPEQLEQIRLIREQNRDERSAINQRVRETNRALQEALDTESPDESQVEQRLRDAGAAQSAAMRLRILTELKIRRVLTAEQRVMLRSLRRRVHERNGDHRLENPEERQNRREDRMRDRRRNPGRPLPRERLQRQPIL